MSDHHGHAHLGHSTDGASRPDPRIEVAWAQHRRRVFDVGYRLLGSVAEAEDVVQETYARLLDGDRVDVAEIDDLVGWLVTVSSRLCLDRLRRHEHRRRSYAGPWLPEPVVRDGALPVEDRVTLDQSVRMALLVVLEQLSPAERTAFVLHDVFGLSFIDVGAVVGRSPSACRQLASRARRRIAADPAAGRFEVDPSEHDELARRFARACEIGDLDGLIEVLAADVVGDFDSGGAIPGAPTSELVGADAVAKQLVGAMAGSAARFRVADVNGEPGVVVEIGGRVVAVIWLSVHDGRIDRLHGVGNPAKLRHLRP